MKRKCWLVHIEDSQVDADIFEILIRDLGLDLEFIRMRDGEELLLHPQTSVQKDFLMDNKIVILDLGLPKMSGHEDLELLRKDKNWNSTRIVVFSGSENPEDRVRCLKLGADAYFIKPNNLLAYQEFIREPLMKEVNQAFSQPPPAGP